MEPGQSKASWYYQGCEETSVEILSDCLVEIFCPLLIVWEMFFYRCASKEMCLSASHMTLLCWNNMLLLSLVGVVFVCPRWSFRVSERWNWLRKDSGLNSLRRLCCYGHSGSSCFSVWCYLVNILLPACSPPFCPSPWSTAEISREPHTETLIFIRAGREGGALCSQALW